MGRDPIPRRRSFPGAPMRGPRSTRYQPRFPAVVPVRGEGRSRVTHPFATLFAAEAALTVRLACVRHAASVHPEPGSNSSFGRPGGRLDSKLRKSHRNDGPGPWVGPLVELVSRRRSPPAPSPAGAPHAFLSVFLGIRFSRFPGRLIRPAPPLPSVRGARRYITRTPSRGQGAFPPFSREGAPYGPFSPYDLGRRASIALRAPHTFPP